MPGNQVKDWDKYHALRKENYSKESAARIVNSQAQVNAISDRLKKGGKNGTRKA